MANASAKQVKNDRTAKAILIRFIALWSVFVLAMDGAVAFTLHRQSQTESYASTTGELIRSEVTRHRGTGDAQSQYRAHLEYRYEVAGRNYRGQRYSHSLFRDPVRFARGHDPGEAITVYYDPDAPGRAVLARGIAGPDLLSVLLVIPFNAFGLLLVYAVVISQRPYGRGPAGLRETTAENGAPALAYRPTDEFIWAMIGLIGGAVAAFGFLAWFDRALAPSFDNALRALIGALAVGGLGALAGHLHRLFGRRKRIVIDYDNQRLTVPVRGGPRTIPFHHITEIRVQHTQPLLLYHDGDPDRPRLVRLPTLSATRAQELARWLRYELALPEPA